MYFPGLKKRGNGLLKREKIILGYLPKEIIHESDYFNTLRRKKTRKKSHFCIRKLKVNEKILTFD